MRLDKYGRDVTDLPGLWDESDCEIVQTKFSHPDMEDGQHTNGPAPIWIRLIGGDWVPTSYRSMHMARATWRILGIAGIERAVK